MKRNLIVLFGSMIFMIPASPLIISKSPSSPRQTGYTIDTRLDAVTKTVAGSMKAFWVNMSTDIVPDIQLNLYMSAFINN